MTVGWVARKFHLLKVSQRALEEGMWDVWRYRMRLKSRKAIALVSECQSAFNRRQTISLRLTPLSKTKETYCKRYMTNRNLSGQI